MSIVFLAALILMTKVHNASWDGLLESTRKHKEVTVTVNNQELQRVSMPPIGDYGERYQSHDALSICVLSSHLKRVEGLRCKQYENIFEP